MAGINPNARQLLTAGAVTPAIAATAFVPPKASITSFGVLNIRSFISTMLNLSRVKTCEIDNSRVLKSNEAMSNMRLETIPRLNALQIALGADPKEIAEVLDVSPSTWSNWRNPDVNAMIPVRYALVLWKTYGVTLEWIYDGAITTITDEKLRISIIKAERQLAA